MKKIFLSALLMSFLAGPALATNGGGKKKAKKKANVECKADKCDPKDCDPKNCDPKCCDYKACPAEEKCAAATACKGS
jgi:hypothetical protein